MRKLIITRGLPGSGKSTTLQKTGLKDFTISTDQLRMLYSSPIMTDSGRLSLSQDINVTIWPVLFSLLERRMSNGATTVIDAVHPNKSDFHEYMLLAKKYRYEIACLDFSEVPKEYSDWTNAGRAEYLVVPDVSLERMQRQISESEELPEEIKNIKVQANGAHLKEVNEWLMPEVHNLSKYKEVIHIGDIQGCMTPLEDALKNGIEDDKFYIFVGDFCDRGEENGQVVRYLVDNVIGRPNVVTIAGNHETHLFREIQGEEPVSEEFRLFTKKHFSLHGISHKDLKKLVSGIQDVFFYQYNDKKVMVSHGGLPKVPKYPWMIPCSQYEKGVGFYDTNVDDAFNKTEESWYQVHGHRNNSKLPIVNNRSINLEGGVEWGGYLRTAILDNNGFRGEQYKNSIVRPWRQRLRKENQMAPEWMKREAKPNPTFLEPEILEALRAHEGVIEKPSSLYPDISSLNFSKDIFYNKAWDEVVNKARGLFINKHTGEIIARSYDKYFTINENKSMSLDRMDDWVEWPVIGRQKENGFLGILGYISGSDELFITSKGTPDGDFAGYFADIFNKTVRPEVQDSIKRTLRDWECSFTFEVIDPIRDPHIIKYDEPKIVLLDVVRRASEYEKMAYGDVLEVGKKFSLEVAPRLLRMNDFKQFSGWFNKSSKDLSKTIEGLVWTDKKGQMFKTKYPFYSIWKLMRGTKDAIMREKEKMIAPLNSQEVRSIQSKVNKLHDNVLSGENKDLVIERLKKTGLNRVDLSEIVSELHDKNTDSDAVKKIFTSTLAPVKHVSRQSCGPFLKTRDLEFATELADDFRNWCFEQSPETLKKEIIELRDEYYADRKNTLEASSPKM